MLVLTRKKGESIMIGNDIAIHVLGVEGDVVKIGISAPQEIPVFRKELYEAIQAANQQALVGGGVISEELQNLLKKSANHLKSKKPSSFKPRNPKE